MRLYKQYVRPHVEFSTPAWAPWTEADIQCLEDVQRRAVRMVSGLSSTTYEEKLQELGLTTLEERRHQADMCQTFKILHGIDHVENMFVKAEAGERVTRMAADPLNVKIPRARLEIRRNFFANRAPAAWNKIPMDMKNANSIEKFKSLYKAHRSKELVAVQEES